MALLKIVMNSSEGCLICKLETDILFSLDVVSLFTNIPLELALSDVKRRWEYIENQMGIHTNIPLEPFIRALEFVLSSTYFTFNDVVYQQTLAIILRGPQWGHLFLLLWPT